MRLNAPSTLTLAALALVITGCAGCRVGGVVGIANLGYADDKVVTLYNATGTHVRIAHDSREPDEHLRRVTYFLPAEDVVITYALRNGPHKLWVQKRDAQGKWRNAWSITVRIEARNNPCFTIYDDGAAPCK